ncbi:P-loop containing nucleoside triphosphate hydrolase protein [Apodospora peruviana]|uniref:P-loop containing nucleoside triphosphate hydrolase protein n=1 Tax=Apodospora peruviana TaxID=516989 RepID=A0AAE0IBF0_9PEZI|nr:P-loop containing nucleoside triphosphate hydrolase protein [Apodospora peruviana]
MNTFNAYAASSVLLFSIPAFYLLASPRKRATKPPPKEGESPRRGWREYIDEMRIFIPVLIPKDEAMRRKIVFSYIIVLVCLVADRLLKLASPILLRQIVVMLASDDPTMRLPWVEVVLFVLCERVFSRFTWSVSSHYRSTVSTDVADVFKLTLYNKLLNQSAEYHENVKSGSVWETVSTAGRSAIHYFSYLVLQQLPVAFDVLLGVGTCWMVFDKTLALSMLGVIVAYMWISISMEQTDNKDVQTYYTLYRNALDIGHDTLQNWQTVSYFNRLEYERSRFSEAVSQRTNAWRNLGRPLSRTKITKNVLGCLGVGGVCLLGCYQIRYSSGNAGDFAMLFQFWTALFEPIEDLAGILTGADQFLAENQKCIEILKLEPKVKDREDAEYFKPGDSTIEFNNVNFSYNDQREVVKDVSFKVEGGTTLAIVGETGGGKSTMLKLLCRAYDVTGGSIKIDGQDIRSVRLASLREHISVVPQTIGVFNVSILENLRYANLEATKEQVEDACRAAALHNRIMSFPNGYDEKVGEKGVKLSGGELQRLAIARALLRKAQIVLFDEATSNLDAETEGRIQDYLRKWYKGRTVIVVAHRLATVANADLIIAFKDGVIVEAGRHDDLVSKQGYFFRLWEKQRLAWEPSKNKKDAPEEKEQQTEEGQT